MQTPIKIASFFLSASLLLTSCGDGKKAEEATIPESAKVDSAVISGTPVNEFNEFKFHLFLANIPSPIGLVDQLPKAGMPFKKELVNMHENSSKYLTTGKKAMNFGVYGADIAYLSTNEQFTDFKKYLTVSRDLAQSLDAGDIFDKAVGTRIENNLDNKDTITQIMDNAYGAIDDYMRTNERQMISAQMVTGSWIESQYLTLSLLKDFDKNDQNGILYQKTFEARVHLQNLVKVLVDFENDKEFKPIIAKMKELEKDLTAMKTEDFTKDNIAKLAPKVAAIRSMIVN